MRFGMIQQVMTTQSARSSAGRKQDLVKVANVVLHLHRRSMTDSMNALDAALDIPLGHYADWSDAERVAVNVQTLYRDFAGAETSASTIELFQGMATLWNSRRDSENHEQGRTSEI